MRRASKPLWMYGAPLDAAAIQQQDAYHEAVVSERAATLAPYGWGLLDVELDAHALRSGVVRFTRFVAVMPGGTLVRADTSADSDLLPDRPLDDVLARAESVDIVVALPQVALGTPNVDRIAEWDEPRDAFEGVRDETMRLVPARTDNPPGAPVPRFTTVVEEVRDFSSGRPPSKIATGRYNLRVTFGPERRDGMEAIKVAELVRSPAGTLVLRDAFVPPLLRTGASRFVTLGLQQVFATVHAKQQALAAKRRQRSASLVEFQASDAARFWLLHTLNQKLAMLAEVASKPETHPAAAYRELAELVGMLCTFDVELTPLMIPRYDHLALGPVFERLFAMASALLERLIAERHVQIPFDAHPNGVLVAHVRDPALFRHALFLAVESPHGSAYVRDNVPRYAKIASAGQLPAIINSATSGLSLAPQEHPPGALPVRPGVVFFRLNHVPGIWNDVVATGTIAVHLHMQDVQLALYAVDPETLQ